MHFPLQAGCIASKIIHDKRRDHWKLLAGSLSTSLTWDTDSWTMEGTAAREMSRLY